MNNFFKELKRRNIYKVAVTYALTGWIIIQIATNVFPILEFPQWTSQFVIILILIGFPIALVFAWAFEITPDGIQRTGDVPEEASISHETGRSLNYWIIGLLTVALMLVLAERIWWAGTYTESTKTSKHTAEKPEQKPSVAVLPFEDFSPKGDQQWFSDGLTEEILNSLARLRELRVPARTSSFQFRDSDLSVSQIADSLQVKHILEGSVRRMENDLRVTVQLIQASNGSHLWSRTYKRSVEDVFKVQEDIATRVAGTLDIYLDEAQRERMISFGTRNVQAYEAYLKGLEIYHEAHGKWELELLWEANKWFEQATRLDSTFSHAYYMHSDPYIHQLIGGKTGVDSLARPTLYKEMQTDLSQAIRHSNNEGARLLYRFTKNMLSTDWSELPDIAKQISQSPEAYDVYMRRRPAYISGGLGILGYAELAHKLELRAIKQDPLSTTAKLHDALRLVSMGKVDSALIRYAQVDYPDGNVSILLLAGQHRKARSLLSEMKRSESIFPLLTLGSKLLYDQVKMSETELDSLTKSRNTINRTVFLYFAGGYRDKANHLAHQIDTSRYGFLKIWGLIFDLGSHHLYFDLKSTPNLARRFKEANIETTPDTLYGRPVRSIVQRDLNK